MTTGDLFANSVEKQYLVLKFTDGSQGLIALFTYMIRIVIADLIAFQ